MARRAAAGSGTIRKKTQIKNGKEYTWWEARYTVGYDPGTGKQIQRSISGKTQKVKIRFSNHLANVVIDRFGKDIPIRKVNEKHFETTLSVAVSPQFFAWVFGLAGGAKIAAPKEVCSEMRRMLKETHEMYVSKHKPKPKD